MVHRAHWSGLAVASMLRGIERFGASSQIDTSRLLSLYDDLPAAVIVDDAARIDEFLPQLDESISAALVILDVDVVHYIGNPSTQDRAGRLIVTMLAGLAAGFGALARHGIDRAGQQQSDSELPYGTFTINAFGSLVLRLIGELGAHYGPPSGPAVVFSAGSRGGYTTWSPFAYEAVALAEIGALREAAANVPGSVTVGLLAACGGFAPASP